MMTPAAPMGPLTIAMATLEAARTAARKAARTAARGATVEAALAAVLAAALTATLEVAMEAVLAAADSSAIAQTTTLGARRAAAAAFVDAFALRGDGALALAVDDPEAGEPFDAVFAPWPMRFYVLQRDAADAEVYVRFVSAPRDCGEIEIASFRTALLVAAAKPVLSAM